MNFNGKDHATDRYFRSKLRNADVGPQSHLWGSIEASLEENKKSEKILAFGWYSRLLILFTLLSFGVILAYKFKAERMDDANHQIEQVAGGDAIIKERLGQETTTQASSESIITSYVSVNQEIKTKVRFSGTTIESINVKEIKRKDVVLEDQMELNTQSSKDPNTKGVDKENSLQTGDYEYADSPAGIDAMALDQSYTMIDASRFLTKALASQVQINSRSRGQIKDDCFTHRKSPLQHVELDLYYSPEVSMRSLAAKNDAAIPYAQKRAGAESFTGAGSLGLRVSYITRRGVGLRTGLSYGKIKERFEYFNGYDTTWTIVYDPNNKPIDTTYSYNSRILTKHNVYKFLDLPVLLTYELNLSDFVLSFNGGLGINLAARASGEIYDRDLKNLTGLGQNQGEAGKQPYYKTNAGLSIIGGFGLNYKINRRLMLLAEPSARYYINSITSDGYELKQNYLQLGIITGLRYVIY